MQNDEIRLAPFGIADGCIADISTFKSSLFLSGRDVGQLLRIDLQTGEVEAPSLEAASEAGRVFVESIRHYLRLEATDAKDQA